MNIGERIKKVRTEELNLNQTEFGRRIGVKQGSIASYETGNRQPLDSVILAICREFGVSEDWLRYGEGEMFLKLDADEYLAGWMGSVLASKDDDKRKRITSILSRLSDAGIEALYTLYEEGVRILREDEEHEKQNED